MERIENFKRKLLFLGVLAVFLSKAAFNVLYGLLALVGIGITVNKIIKSIKENKNKNKKENKKINHKLLNLNKYDKLMLLLFLGMPIGMVANLYSSGFEGMKYFMKQEAFLFTILIFLMLDLKKEDFRYGNIAMVIGGVVSSVYTILGYFDDKLFLSNPNFSAKERMGSFQNQIRFGALLSAVIPIQYANIFSVREWYKKILFLIGLVLLIYASLLNGGRATWVAVVVSILLFTGATVIVRRKKYKTRYILLATILTFTLAGYTVKSNPRLYERAKSIFYFDLENPLETHSEQVRIGFIKVGLDMTLEKPVFGWGSKNPKESLNKFLEQKGDEYKTRYLGEYFQLEFATPFENTYINNLVENGIIFALWSNIGFLALVFFFLYRVIKKDKIKEVTLATGIIAVLIGTKIYFFFFPGSDRYIEFLNLMQLFYLKELAKDRNEEKD